MVAGIRVDHRLCRLRAAAQRMAPPKETSFEPRRLRKPSVNGAYDERGSLTSSFDKLRTGFGPYRVGANGVPPVAGLYDDAPVPPPASWDSMRGRRSARKNGRSAPMVTGLPLTDQPPSATSMMVIQIAASSIARRNSSTRARGATMPSPRRSSSSSRICRADLRRSGQPSPHILASSAGVRADMRLAALPKRPVH